MNTDSYGNYPVSLDARFIEDAKSLCQVMNIVIRINQLKGHFMNTSRLLCQMVGTQTSIDLIQSSFNKVAMMNLFAIKD